VTYVCRLTRDAREETAYFALRREIFCDEQGLFAGSDRDACDEGATPMVCVTAEDRVVGVVRIWEEAPGQWWGGRLGVHPDFRAVGAIGRWLVLAAVGTARGWGATRFRATVQRANVPLFRRLHWRSLDELVLHGQPHHLMEADLIRTPAVVVPRPGAGREAA
jgi:putative N-acetyltransferase (TIGR04045 family)